MLFDLLPEKVILPLHKPYYENFTILSFCIFLKFTHSQNLPNTSFIIYVSFSITLQ